MRKIISCIFLLISMISFILYFTYEKFKLINLFLSILFVIWNLLFTHEIIHVIFCKLSKCKIESVNVFPFILKKNKFSFTNDISYNVCFSYNLELNRKTVLISGFFYDLTIFLISLFLILILENVDSILYIILCFEVLELFYSIFSKNGDFRKGFRY